MSSTQSLPLGLLACTAIAAAGSLLSFGTLSLLALVVALFMDSSTDEYRLKKRCFNALMLHVALWVFLLLKAIQLSGLSMENLLTLLATHWLLDFMCELIIGIYLAIGLIRAISD